MPGRIGVHVHGASSGCVVVDVHRVAMCAHVKEGRITHVALQNKVSGRMTRRKMKEMALLLITKPSSVEISRSVLIPT